MAGLSMRRMYGSVVERNGGGASSSTLPSTSNAEDDPSSSSVVVVSKSRKGSTIASGVVNLTNTIVGAGMLGLPGAFGGTGWLAGTFLIILSASFSAHGLVLLSRAACLTGRPSSFYSLALASVPGCTMLIDAAVALKCFGVATGYLITISDSMVNVLHHMIMTGDPERDDRFLISLLLSRHFWVVGAMASVLPFCFYRTLDELKRLSALALVFVFMLVGMIIAYAHGIADPCMGNVGGEVGTCKGDIVPFTNIPSTLTRLPIFVFSFTCHQNIFPIVNELELLSQRRLNIVICSSISFALVIFSAVAIEGYRTYGSAVRGDILLNYPENKQVTFLRMCIAFMLTLHYPLQLDPSRRCISSMVEVVIKWWGRKKAPSSVPNAISGKCLDGLEFRPEEVEEESLVTTEEGEPNHDSSYTAMVQSNIKKQLSDNDSDDSKGTIAGDKIFYGITFTFLLLSFTLATIVDDLGVVLALVGATGSTLVSYILPGLIYVRVYPLRDMSLAMAYIQLLLGIVMMPLALYFILTNKVNH